MTSKTRSIDFEAFRGEHNRWEKLQDVFAKLSMVLETPQLRVAGGGDLLDQMEQRLLEAARLFPEPDWMAGIGEDFEGIERYFANHLGTVLAVLLKAAETLAEERSLEGAGLPARDQGA